MTPAEEIATKVISNCTNCSAMDMYVRMINEARREAIEECAKRAKCKIERVEFYGKMIPEYVIDKESILNLIKELK